MPTFSFKKLSESYQSRHEPEKYIAAAHAIWAILLCVAGVAIVSGVAYGVWQYVAPPATAVTETTAGGITGFNRAQLTHVVEFFNKRQATFEGMMSGE